MRGQSPSPSNSGTDASLHSYRSPLTRLTAVRVHEQTEQNEHPQRGVFCSFGSDCRMHRVNKCEQCSVLCGSCEPNPIAPFADTTGNHKRLGKSPAMRAVHTPPECFAEGEEPVAQHV